MERLENVAVPLTAATVVAPLSVPPPGLLPIATVTFAVDEVKFPNWSSIWTVTAGAIDWAATVLVGCWMNANLAGAPALTVNGLLDPLIFEFPVSVPMTF